MKALDVGKHADRRGDRFPLRIGRQRIAMAHARGGWIVKIHVHPHVRLVEDETELELVDDESGARMDND